MEQVLECQTCGMTLRTLSPEEAKEVASRPYDFVMYCVSCRRDMAQWAQQSEGTLTDDMWRHP